MIESVPRRQLIGITRFFAREIAAGRHADIEFDRTRRWHRRLFRDADIDIWVISWLSEQGTELHDHGGSSGAFTVLRGTLTETVLSSAGVRDHERRSGMSVGFGRSYIHDVRNCATSPAVSVHAYSPPLTTMNYYDVRDSAIVSMRTIHTDDPEPTMPVALPTAS